MTQGYATTFNLLEWLSITGFVQCVLILVYIVFRVRSWRQASIAIAYFLFLTFAFALQFALRLEDFSAEIRLALWFSWAMGPPLCYLLVMQVVKLTDLPDRKHFWILLAMPAVFALVFLTRHTSSACEGPWRECARLLEYLYWLGSMAGALCMLAIWGHRDIFSNLLRERRGKERYWLILTLVSANVLGVVVNLLRSTGNLAQDSADALSVTLGIAFAYLATTTLFRVYPAPVQLNDVARMKRLSLTAEEKGIAEKVRRLLELDKVYQEPAFSRADLAREVGTSESTLSKVINAEFGKSFPQLLNEFRVEDAKRMLLDHTIPVQVVAAEAGFNSLASFNRVFRDLTGDTPTAFRGGGKK